MNVTEHELVPLDKLEQLRHDAAMWQKHKDSFKVLHDMLDVASPLVLNRLKSQDAVVDSQKSA